MFYAIDNRTDKEVGNVYPQVSCVSQALAHQLCADTFHDGVRELRFELQSGAKCTDVLSQAAISASGLLVSARTQDLLAVHSLMRHRWISCAVKTRSASLPYYWLHLVDMSLLETIDFPASRFYRTEYGFREHDVCLSSFADYEAAKRQFGNMGTIESDYLSLSDHLRDHYDLLALPLFDSRIYVSEKLRDVLAENKITGVQYQKGTGISL